MTVTPLIWSDRISPELVKKINSVTKSTLFRLKLITENEYTEITKLQEWNGSYLNFNRPVAVNKRANGQISIYCF